MLEPVHLLVLLRLSLEADPFAWSEEGIAGALHLSIEDVRRGLTMAEAGGLYRSYRRAISHRSLADFLVHGVRYAYPPIYQGVGVLGVPTAWAAPPLLDRIAAPFSRAVVWPSPHHGEVVGEGLLPLHPEVPRIALEDPRMYELLVLVDALRMGRVRERLIAKDALEQRWAA